MHTSPRISAFVAHLVSQHGWKADSSIPNVATRDYDTAVGPKQASIWLTTCQTTGDTYLWPRYDSEGRNAAESTVGYSCSLTPDAQALEELDAYVQRLDECIGQTFAARLLKRGVTA